MDSKKYISPKKTETVAQSFPKATKAKTQKTTHKHWGVILSFVLCVILPGIISSVYWSQYAADRYVTQAGFIVKSVDEGGTPDLLGSLTGLSGGTSGSSDTAVVLSFLHSRDIVGNINQKFDLRDAFSKTDDRFYKIKDGTVEDLVNYWENRVVVTHDTTTGLVTYDVNAFTKEDSLQIANLILLNIEDLVNQISQKARADVLKASQGEVERSQERLRQATQEQLTFRQTEESLNPFGTGEATVALISQIEATLSETRREISSIEKSNVRDDSPVLQNLRIQEETLEEQISEIKATSQNDATLMSQFEQIELNKMFAQEAYSASLISLEQARVRAERAQRYLAIFRSPKEAERAVLPNRLQNTLISLLALFAAWSILTLLSFHVKDKMV
jgi:capsular polysaccharide transport system permease protein